ncbi:tRNA 2-thiouridine(34) synthase MnmA [Candidatus Saccharibacteria bacterium]|nr:tRNA 2-thiouridine(34) synthase MnmA [Candidatus Saccharibacteria bacterium]
MSKTVFLGMSGGVDSSLSAVLLKEQGYNVVGVYMKNWSRDLPGMKCPWAEDLADAKRVATKLGIDFRVFDFETEYKQKVVDYMLTEFKKGRTPNPDIMCNQEVKFKLFYDVAREQGADLIATGHYAQNDGKNLLKAVDENKDQTYFLYRISEDAIAHTLFPIGHLTKPEVKKLAAEKSLDNAYKKESMGVCFVGEVGMKDFLKEYFPVTPGDIVDEDTGEKVGTHEGAIFYTIGQRGGLNLGGGLPYYVTRKDVEHNVLYVSRNLNAKELWTRELELEDVIIRGEAPIKLNIRLRHRAPLIPATFDGQKLTFTQEIKRPAAGQSAVFYADDICIGGGIIK